jgi:hypothetical protein
MRVLAGDQYHLVVAGDVVADLLQVVEVDPGGAVAVGRQGVGTCWLRPATVSRPVAGPPAEVRSAAVAEGAGGTIDDHGQDIEPSRLPKKVRAGHGSLR